MIENSFKDLVEQTFDFPQTEFDVNDDKLMFNNIELMDIVQQYGVPLKITYLPKIGEKIRFANDLFLGAMKKHAYNGDYTYCYCTKSNHFSFVVEEALKHDAQLEISYGFDVQIIRSLERKNKILKDIKVICNGHKTEFYREQIIALINAGFSNVIPVADTIEEIQYYNKHVKGPVDIGIRLATEEEPNFEFYTSRLGIRNHKIIDQVLPILDDNDHLNLKMLHFFVDTGMKDTAYYWTEFSKALSLYIDLKKLFPSLTDLNIGGGFPFKDALDFDYDFEYMVDEIIFKIKEACKEANIDVPNIFTEFGKFSVAESGASIYKVMFQKQQNDRENWYMINGSIMSSIPDIWGMDQKFIVLPLNKWNDKSEIVNIGGLSCDNEDYYNSEIHKKQLFLPKMKDGEELYIGFFHTGAYQDALAGYGGVKHCLIPAPKHIIIDKDENGKLVHHQYRGEQMVEPMLEILGY